MYRQILGTIAGTVVGVILVNFGLIMMTLAIISLTPQISTVFFGTATSHSHSVSDIEHAAKTISLITNSIYQLLYVIGSFVAGYSAAWFARTNTLRNGVIASSGLTLQSMLSSFVPAVTNVERWSPMLLLPASALVGAWLCNRPRRTVPGTGAPS
jgi:MFS family permease